MNQLTVIDDVAARRSAAANKAWSTRRQQGWMPGSRTGVQKVTPTSPAEKSTSAETAALAAFEREASSDMPDWHRAALALRQALGQKNEKTRFRATIPCSPRSNSLLSAPKWNDYPVDRVSSFSIRTDILVVTFADGEIVRAPAVSAKGIPTNIGRGLRIAIAFYQARACRRRGFKFRPGVHAAVPAIAACICEDSGETFDAEECTVRTVETRKAQDWRIRR